MSTNVVSKVLDQVTSQVASIAGITNARVYQGQRRFQETDNFEAAVKGLVQESQAFASVSFGERRAKGQIKAGGFTIDVMVYILQTKDTSTITDTMYDLMELICIAVQQEAAYYGLGMRPVGATYRQDDDDTTEDSIVVFEMEVEFEGGLIGGAM